MHASVRGPVICLGALADLGSGGGQHMWSCCCVRGPVRRRAPRRWLREQPQMSTAIRPVPEEDPLVSGKSPRSFVCARETGLAKTIGRAAVQSCRRDDNKSAHKNSRRAHAIPKPAEKRRLHAVCVAFCSFDNDMRTASGGELNNL